MLLVKLREANRRRGNPFTGVRARVSGVMLSCRHSAIPSDRIHCMAFDAKLVEAQLALELIASEDMPRIAWDALEAGFDGTAIRRLAALDRPTYFEVAEVLPRVRQELGLSQVTTEQAATRVSIQIARQILASGDDPMNHLRDFESLWSRAGYPQGLGELGTLYDDVWIARTQGDQQSKIKEWVSSVLSDFVRSHEE